MLGDSSATPLVPSPPLLVCAMIQQVNLPQEMSGAPVVDRMDILVHQKNNGAWTWLALTLPTKRRTIYITYGLDHLPTYLAFPHWTDVQSSYSATCVHISQGLDKDIFFKKGGWFCRRRDCCHGVNSQWMGQKFNFKSNDWCHVGLYYSITLFSLCRELKVWNSDNLFTVCWHQRIQQQSCMARMDAPRDCNSKIRWGEDPDPDNGKCSKTTHRPWRR